MRRNRRFIMGLFIAAAMVSPLGVLQTHAASGHRISAACGFKHAVWTIAQYTAIDAHYIRGYGNGSTDDVQNDRAPLDEEYSRAEVRYGYPLGSYPLSVALGQVWTHIWDYAYWSNQWSDDIWNDASQAQYDTQQEWNAINGANASMSTSWDDLKGICPGR